MTRDGVLSFALDRASGVVRVYDLLNGSEVAVTPVCKAPMSAALSSDDVSFVVQCGVTPGNRMYVNTASYAVAPPPQVLLGPRRQRPCIELVHAGSYTRTAVSQINSALINNSPSGPGWHH